MNRTANPHGLCSEHDGRPGACPWRQCSECDDVRDAWSSGYRAALEDVARDLRNEDDDWNAEAVNALHRGDKRTACQTCTGRSGRTSEGRGVRNIRV